MRRLLALLALTLLVSSCSWFRKEEPRACPRLGIVADAADLVRYREGGGRDITDQLFTARVGDVAGNCRFDKAGSNVDIKVSLGIAKGKRKVDKRQDEKTRDWQRDKARLMRDKG